MTLCVVKRYNIYTIRSSFVLNTNGNSVYCGPLDSLETQLLYVQRVTK